MHSIVAHCSCLWSFYGLGHFESRIISDARHGVTIAMVEAPVNIAPGSIPGASPKRRAARPRVQKTNQLPITEPAIQLQQEETNDDDLLVKIIAPASDRTEQKAAALAEDMKGLRFVCASDNVSLRQPASSNGSDCDRFAGNCRQSK